MSDPWILKTFQIDETGNSGAYLFIEARKPGLIAWILNLMGLDPTASLRVTKGAISFRKASLSGLSQTSTALTQIGSFQGGYSKPIGFIIFAGLFLFSGFFGFIAMFDTSDDDVGFIFLITGVILALIMLALYALQKNLMFGFETSGGAYYGLAFKRGVLNNVSVDIDQVEYALTLVNALIGAASVGGDYTESFDVSKVGKVQPVFGNQQPQSPATPAPAAPAAPAAAPAPAATLPQPVIQEPVHPAEIESPLPEAVQTSVGQNMPVSHQNHNPSRIKIYELITKSEINIGTFEEFDNKMDDINSRWRFYSLATSSNLPLGTWDDFNSKMS